MSSVAAEWAKKRARILSLYRHSCTWCGAVNTRLNVHHRYYEAGKQPWEYPEASLDCLCDTCHGRADEIRRRLARSSGLLGPEAAERAIGYMDGIDALEFAPISMISVPKNCRDRCSYCRGIGDAFGVTENHVIDLLIRFPGGVAAIEIWKLSQKESA